MSSRSKPDRGDVALVDVDEVLVDPAVGLRARRGRRSARTARRRCASCGRCPRRSTLGPRSRKRAGSQVSHTCGGSTTWSSTLTIVGSSQLAGRWSSVTVGLHLGSDGVSDTLPGHLTGRQIGSAAMPLDLAALVAPTAHGGRHLRGAERRGGRALGPAGARRGGRGGDAPACGRLAARRPGRRRAGGALHRLPARRRQGRQHQRPAVHGRAQVAGGAAPGHARRWRCVAELGPEPERPRAHPHPRARPDGGHRPRSGAAQPRRRAPSWSPACR